MGNHKPSRTAPVHLRAGCLCLSALAALSAAPVHSDEGPPNIVFILADDLGYGDLGSYGQVRFATPNIDRLASEGMRFTQVYSGSTVCAPSRCALMTGLHTGHGLVRGNANDGAGIPLGPGDLTVAEALHCAGYRTGLFGKWSLGVEETTGSPPRKGFDESFGYLDQRLAHRYSTDQLVRNGVRVSVDPKAYSHDLIIEGALDFVRRSRERPFFLYLAVTIPHAELRVPEDSLAPFRGRFPPEKPFLNPDIDAHPEKRGYRSQADPRAAFAGMVTRLDRDVGRLLALLAGLGIDRRTCVFFSSDNGPHREGGADPDYFRSSGPLRGIKRDLTEGGIRVPMLVRWPGTVPEGVVSQQVWAFWDFLPTACEIAGAGAPSGIDGISMLPAILNRPQRSHDFLYWEFFEGGFQQAVRRGDWKAIRTGQGRALQLYDLAKDMGEARECAAEHPEVVERIEAYLKTARTESPLWKPPPARRL